jgi:hypothetical protein
VSQKLVKLFDGFGILATLDESDRTEKPSVTDDTDHIQCIMDVVERVTVDDDEIGTCAGRDAPGL